MKREINVLFTLILLYSGNLLGQTYIKEHTYLDALELKKIYTQNRQNSYTDNTNLANAFDSILEKYNLSFYNIDSNIFLRDYIVKKSIFESIGGEEEDHNIASYKKSGKRSTSLSSVNFQASAVNGMASFMAGRFKQEVLHVAIDQMFKKIRTKDDSILVKSIFPKTFKQIGNLYGTGSSSYYTGDLLLLRQTAQIDIEQIPKNITRNAEFLFPILMNETKTSDLVVMEGYLYEYSNQGQPLDNLLTSLANGKYSSGSTIHKIINVADLISQAMLDTIGSKNTWINPSNLLSTDSIKVLEVKYFYGLLYQQLIQIPEFKYYLESQNPDDIVLIATKIQDLAKFVEKLNDTYEYIESKEYKLKSSEEIVSYLKKINQSLSTFTTTLQNIPEINQSLNLNDEMTDIPEKYLTVIESILKKEYYSVIPLLLIEFGDYMGINQKTSRTIAFVSQLATMESADDMEALISSYSLPIGSSSIKRHSSFNLSVNGFVGLTGGWETAYGTQKNQTKGNIGLSAPIGISTTFSKGYLTTFVSFIDLGSIVNQRLNNDTTAYSNLKLEQFFSIGLGLFVNHPKLPITAGLHFSFVPNLRTIKYERGNATITESNRSVTRINFSLLVDIPLFTFYNKENQNNN